MALVSANFERLLNESFLGSLNVALHEALPVDRWDIQPLTDSKRIAGEEAYVLTVSSHLFRIFTVLHFNFDEHMEAFVNEALGQQRNGPLTKDKCYDYIAEVGNIFCGALKRELQQAVAALGMSTPNLLNHACIKYISSLKLDCQGHAVTNLDGHALFYASYYLSAYGELNYTKVIQQKEVVAEVGELELF